MLRTPNFGSSAALDAGDTAKVPLLALCLADHLLQATIPEGQDGVEWYGFLIFDIVLRIIYLMLTTDVIPDQNT